MGLTPEERAKAEAKGFKVGTAAEFLGLTPEEQEMIEFRLNPSEFLQRKRAQAGQTQSSLARRIHSSQSRIAKAEASDPSVSTDLLFKALFASGATRREIAEELLKGA